MNHRHHSSEEKAVQHRVHGAEHRLKDLTLDMHEIWRRSCDELEPGSPIDLYAVDTDVVVMFMQPAREHHYGALLRYDGAARQLEDEELQELETRLVDFLGNLIFFQLPPGCAPILVGEHAHELERILARACDAVMKLHPSWAEIAAQLQQASDNVTQTSISHLQQAAHLVEPDPAARKALSREDIDRLLKEIQDQLRGHGHISKLFRFDLLAGSERVLPLERVPVVNADGSASAFPTPVAPDGKYLAPVGRLAARLLQRMKQIDTGHTHRRDRNNHSDAIVLAHLAWLNEQLETGAYYLPVQGGPPRRIGRILLISGSQLLPRAIKDLNLRELEQTVFSPLALLGHQLMEQFVLKVHPEVAGDTSGGPDKRSSSLISFLEAMRATLSQAVREDNYQKLGDALKNVREKHFRLVDSWKGRQLLGEHSQPKSISDAFEELALAGTTLDGLADFVGKLSVRAWQAFARSVTLLSFKRPSRPGAVQSNLLPLDLSGFPAARRVADDIHRYVFDMSQEAVSAVLMSKATVDALNLEDRSNYTEFLCYALWATAHGKMQNAQGCAELALSIARQSDRPDSEQMRTEAMYLSVHMLKLCAVDRCDLEVARQTMGQLIKDRDAAGLAPDPRFSAELFSIDAHLCYLENFGSGHGAPLEHSERKVGKLLFRFRHGRRLLADLALTPEADGHYRREFIRQQLLVNLGQLALLCKFGLGLRDDGTIEVFIPIEESWQVIDSEAEFCELSEQLIAHFRYLDGDTSGLLPRPSVLSASVVAAVQSIWTLDTGPQEEVHTEISQMDLLDARRGRFLEAARRYRSSAKPAFARRNPARSSAGQQQEAAVSFAK